MEENADQVRNVYRTYMAGELARPEIKEAKKNLGAFFEAPAAPVTPVLGAGFLIPAFAIIALFFSFQYLQSRVPAVVGPSMPIYRILDDPVRNHIKPGVMVKRVSSRVGPTMVYQKVYGGTPVTIIWVFNHGGNPV